PSSQYLKNTFDQLVTLSAGVANISKAMTRMYGALTVDNDQPDLIITTQAIYDAYETSLQANKRFAGSDDIANAGFDSLRFKGATVVVDSHVPAGQMYFLNTDYLDFKVHRDRNFTFEDFKRLEGSDNMQSRLFWMGQLVCTNPRMQGVLGGGPSDYA
ncbi:MAG TPA: phage major capsid protein, partial [Maribacter sp.]|nr:phage major capsid protein [Maribacter sp.]